MREMLLALVFAENHIIIDMAPETRFIEDSGGVEIIRNPFIDSGRIGAEKE